MWPSLSGVSPARGGNPFQTHPSAPSELRKVKSSLLKVSLKPGNLSVSLTDLQKLFLLPSLGHLQVQEMASPGKGNQAHSVAR